MNDKKKLVIALVALVVIIAVSLAVYNAYKDRVDPLTGEMLSASQPQPKVLGARTDAAATAPDFAMEDAEGNATMLSDFQGTPVVLNFWTSWCSYCKTEMPYFESAYQQYGGQVQFVMLNPVKSERNGKDGKNFIAKSGYTFPVFYETAGKVMNLYGLRSFPATVFIDADGSIVKKHMGAITKQKLNDNIETLLAQ